MSALAQRCLLVLFGLLMALLILEAALRLAPVSRGPYGPAVTAADPIFRLYPNQEWSWSKGPLLKLAQVIRTNNVGFVSEIDYQNEHFLTWAYECRPPSRLLLWLT